MVALGLSDFSLPLLVLAPINFFSSPHFVDLWAVWPCLPSTSKAVMRPSGDMGILLGPGLTAVLRGPLVQVGLEDMGHTTAGYGGTLETALVL